MKTRREYRVLENPDTYELNQLAERGYRIEYCSSELSRVIMVQEMRLVPCEKCDRGKIKKYCPVCYGQYEDPEEHLVNGCGHEHLLDCGECGGEGVRWERI